MQGGHFKTKKVHVFINGHTQSKAFNIHPRCRLGWNAILDCFSKTLKPKFGAIRVLRSIDGRKVIEGFNDLKNEGNYVACGLEAFRAVKGGYLTSLETKAKPTEYYPTEILSPDDQKKYPCLIQTMRKGRVLIYVFANGKRTDPKKIVLMKSDYDVWDSILRHIGIILDIPEGVKGLYTVFGQPLCSPHDIQHGGYYVAIPYNASFKSIKYLTARNINSHHESSPMITKETYIAAAKTCTSLGGPPRNRRRSKTTKVEENSREEKVQSDGEDKLEHHVRIEGTRIKKKDDTAHENEIQITNYQKEDFTQTSTIFFEAICNEDHGLVLNEKKYFLVPEREVQRFGSVDKTGWYDGLFRNQPTQEDKKKIETIAGTMIGVIMRVSEKIANKCVYGQSDSEVPSEGVSFTVDTFEPLKQTTEASEDNNSFLQDREARHSICSRDRSLRLSVPIGRISKSKYSDNSSNDSSSDSLDRTEILHDLDKEFKPLTPSHILGTSPLDSLPDNLEDDVVKKASSLLRHLKKDSVGFPIINHEENEDSVDEWKKLDILDDMDLTLTSSEGEDLELLLEDAEYYREGEIPTEEEYTYSDCAESAEYTEISTSTYSNSQDGSAKELDETKYCKRCYAHLKAKKAAKQKDAETQAKSVEYDGDENEKKKLTSEDDIKDISANCPLHIDAVASKVNYLPEDENDFEEDNKANEKYGNEDNEMLKEERNERREPVETIKVNEQSVDESQAEQLNEAIPSEISEGNKESAPIQLMELVVQEDSDIKVVFSSEQSTGYELSSVFSEPVENLILPETFKQNLFAEKAEDRQAIDNNLEDAIETAVRNEIEDQLEDFSEETDSDETWEEKRHDVSECTQNERAENVDGDLVEPSGAEQSIEQQEENRDEVIEETVTTKKYSLQYQKDTEDDRRSLVNFLKLRLESALNTSLLHER